MKVRFLTIELEAFKSFQGKGHKLSFVDRRSGLHFMRGVNKVEPRLGSNGAGKSSVWDAVCWCLYGRTVSGLKNTDIRSWADRHTTRVVVTLTVDATPYDIERTAHPNELLINRKVVGPEAPAKLIGLSYDLFVNTILLGQGQPLFYDLPPRDKMQLFTDVLDLDRWDTRSKKAAGVVADLDTDLATIGAELRGKDEQMGLTEQLLKSEQAKSAEWDEAAEKRVIKLQVDMEGVGEQLLTVRAGYDKALMASEGAGAELKHLDEEVRKIQKLLDDAREERNRYVTKLATSKGQLQELKSQLEAFGSDDKCPICRQPIKGTHVDKHKRELRDRIRELEDAIDKGVPKKVQREVVMQERQLERYEAFQDEWRKKADKADTELRHFGPRKAELEAQVRSIEATIAELESQSNPHTDQISILKKRRGRIKRETDDLIAEQKSLSDRLERTKFWVKGFKDIRLFIIEEVLQQLELTTNAGLAEIGMPDWKVRYAIEKETKAGTIQRGLMVEILSPKNRAAVRWESWSGGEGQRLRLIGALALSETLLNYAGVSTNLEILDEPTRHLSAEGVRELCEYLASRASQLDRQTWLVDHMAVESASFRSVMEVVKVETGSHLAKG